MTRRRRRGFRPRGPRPVPEVLPLCRRAAKEWGFAAQGMQERNESIDDLTVQFEENGQTIVNELDKVVLSKGLWTTILFRYQVWQPEKNAFGPDMFVIRRYKKSGGEYRQQSKFTISSAEQARKIVDALSGWIN